MKYILFCAVLFIYSCNNGSGIKSELKKADQITIHYYSSSQSDSVIKIVHTTNPDAIEKLASFVDNEISTDADCGSDGNIVFTKESKKLFDINFNVLNTKCRQFHFNYNNKIYKTKMGNEAADFLTALWAGKSYY